MGKKEKKNHIGFSELLTFNTNRTTKNLVTIRILYRQRTTTRNACRNTQIYIYPVALFEEGEDTLLDCKTWVSPPLPVVKYEEPCQCHSE